MSISLHATGQPAAPEDDRLTVSDIHGRAFHIKSKGVYVSLSPGTAIEVNRPVKVGPKSRMDLRLKEGGTLELGPGAQVVLFPATREGREDMLVTGLRLDGGYLRVVIPEQAGRTRLDVSSARWQAQLQPGEYVFETQGAESSVCTLSGAMRLSGLPEGMDKPQAKGCVHVTTRAPEVVALASTDWELVQKRRTLLPALARTGEPAKPAAEGATLARMPRTRAVPAAVPKPVSLTRLEAMGERLDRWIEQEQAELADALIASTPTALGLSPTLASVPTATPASPPSPAVDSAPGRDRAPTAAAPAPAPEPAAAASPPDEPPARNDVAVATPVAPAAPVLPLAMPADADSRGEWIINVATYPSLETAEQQAAKLRAQNIQTTIRNETVRGRSSYRVVVEGLATEGDANAMRDRLVSTLGMRQAWVFRKH